MAERGGRKTGRNKQVTDPNQPCKIKLLMLGNLHTGKTSLVRAYCSKDGLSQPESPTTESFSIGLLDCMDRIVDIGGQEVTVEIWDTAGTETYDSITASYYRGADGVCLTYSVVDNKSFDLLGVWMGRIQENTRPHTPILLLGTKSDQEENREVETKRAQSFANEQDDIKSFHEVTTKDRDSIENAVSDFVKVLMKTHCFDDANENLKPAQNQGCCH